MKSKALIYVIFFIAFAKAYAQQLTGQQVIEKAISYHDPFGNWTSFNGEFTLKLEMPDKPIRKSTVTINIPDEYFNVTTLQDGTSTFKEVTKGQCRYTDETNNVLTALTTEEACERSVMFKNYYSYLYGLPMKLKDPGTIIGQKASLKRFKGKEYLVVRVTYDDKVGSDVWQFYFDPITYAMEVYQFFKGTDETTGEYILLTDIATVNGIKMPKDRAWYYNKDNSYLATDKLVTNK